MTELPDPDMARLLAESRTDRFGPGFADRVMRRVQDEPAALSLFVSPAQFWRIAAAGALAAAALVVFSLQQRDASSQSPVEALFGLRPITASAVFDADALADLEG